MQEFTVMNFVKSFTTYARGVEYLRKNKVGSFKYLGKNQFSVTVSGNHNYRVTLSFDSNDRLYRARCTCPYSNGYCKHIAAAALKFDSDLFEMRDDMTSVKMNDLIRMLNSCAQQNDEINEGTEIALYSELGDAYGVLTFSLHISEPGKRSYVVKDIHDLVLALDRGERKRYGKQCDIVHYWKLLSEYGQRLAKLAYSIYCDRMYKYDTDKRGFALTGRWIDSFFELHRNRTVNFSGRECAVIYDYPKLLFSIEKTNDTMFRFVAETNIKCYDIGIHGCIYDAAKAVFYMTDRAFAYNIKTIYENLSGRSIYISETDMPAFYNMVLKPIAEHIEILGDDIIEQYAPPELNTRLYIDAPDKETVTGELVFMYDDKKYRAFKPVLSGSLRDIFGEKKAERLVLKYFQQGINGLYVSGDDNIFEFMTKGLPALTSQMEVYASEVFKRLSVRPPAITSVGIHPGGDLLALDITADGYSTEELLELLGAYRRGKKYHRLRDGSFAEIVKGIEELDELAKSLNITDKMLLKENITIPQYRILYLNSLQSDTEAMRIKRGRDFKKLMDKYDEVAERTAHMDVPDTLQNTVRGYQRHGFRWLKTIEEYGFGGILADDMGLGKTLQAIALMLNAKRERGGKTLVVCPSSLVPNWESEINRFAPELTVFPQSAARHPDRRGLRILMCMM